MATVHVIRLTCVFSFQFQEDTLVDDALLQDDDEEDDDNESRSWRRWRGPSATPFLHRHIISCFQLNIFFLVKRLFLIKDLLSWHGAVHVSCISSNTEPASRSPAFFFSQCEKKVIEFLSCESAQLKEAMFNL